MYISALTNEHSLFKSAPPKGNLFNRNKISNFYVDITKTNDLIFAICKKKHTALNLKT